MGEDEYSILQKKFRDWFREIVPPDVPLLAELDHSLVDLVPPEIPRKRRRRVKKTANFSAAVFHGFRGAILFGFVVGLTLYILSFSFWRWVGYNPLIRLIIIFFAMVMGFYISLIKELASQKRKR